MITGTPLSVDCGFSGKKIFLLFWVKETMKIGTGNFSIGSILIYSGQFDLHVFKSC